MNNQIITTTNGYVVEVKPFITYGQYIEIQKIATEKATFSQSEQQNVVLGDSVFKANEKSIEFLVVKISDSNGTDLGSAVEAMKNLPLKDGVEIMKEINRILGEADIPKKN